MATKEQIQANRANARRSTGPSTPQGKAKSSQNALKHGLRAQITVLPDENIDDFDVLVSELEDEFQPATAIEWTLLRQLADAEWRMRRVPRIEAGVLAKELHETREHYEENPDQLPEDPAEIEIFLIGAMAVSDAVTGDVLARLSRYESRLSHRYFKALAHLRNVQDRRNRPTESQNPAAEEPATGPPSAKTQPPSKPVAAQRSSSDESKRSKCCQTNPIKSFVSNQPLKANAIVKGVQHGQSGVGANTSRPVAARIPQTGTTE